MNSYLTIFTSLLLLCGSLSAASIDVTMSSQFLARGEQAVLEVQLTEVEPPETLRLPAVAGVSIQSRGFGGPSTMILPGRKLGYVYQYIVSSFESGEHIIPAISIRVGNETLESKALKFEVFDGTDISFKELRNGRDVIRYAAFFKAEKKNPYEGENIAVELKIYFPANQRIEEWGIPDFERKDVTAWRFEPRPQIGGAILLGANYQAASYPSTMAAGKAGQVSIGPAKIRLIAVENVIGQFGYEQNAVPLNLVADALQIDAKPLPPNPPVGFTNAVGSFTLEATVDDQEVREGDPLNIELKVTGAGNLDSLNAPVLSDTDGWKLYEATRSELGEERRLQRGSMTFTQFMRPTKRQTVIPPFQLAYFDPSLEQYKVLSTSPIPLTVLPSTNPPLNMGATGNATPPAATVPVETMTDILGIVKSASLLNPRHTLALPQLWHLVPLIIALVLGFAIFHRHFWPRLQSTPEQTKRKQALKELSSVSKESTSFYRAAGRFIETWLPEKSNSNADVQRILQERDQLCFHPEPTTQPVPSQRRNEILRTLRKLTLSLTILCAVGIFPLFGAESKNTATTETKEAATLYEEGQYKESIESWLGAGPYDKLAASTLYNIGNACYRAGSQGYAALYYRRALLAEPGMQEAQQNLRFLERKFGALTIKRPDYQYTLTRIPEAWLKNTLLGSLWGIALALLVFPATRRGSRMRIVAVCAFVLCPLLAATAAIGRHYYPNDSIFAPYAEQAVIVAEKTVIFADASRTSGQVIEAPAGSLCRILRRSDRWVYIAFASQTRGWVPADRIESLIPTSPPTVPDFKALAEPSQPSA